MEKQPIANTDGTTTSLGQKVLNVFCDVVAKEIVAENLQYQEENAALEPIKQNLMTLRVVNTKKDALHPFSVELDISGGEYKHYKDVLTFNLRDSDGVIPLEDNDVLTFNLRDSDSVIPLEDMCFIEGYAAGVSLVVDRGIDYFENNPEFTIGADGVVHIRAFYADYFWMDGTLENFRGSLEGLQKMVNGRRHETYFCPAGRVGLLKDDPSLDGTFFSLATVSIHKCVYEFVLEAHEAIDIDPENNDVLDVCAANPTHKEITEAVAQHRQLVTRNENLRCCRDLFQSFYMWPKEGSPYVFKLDSGHISNNWDGVSSWTMERATSRPHHSMNLSSIAQCFLTMAGVPIGRYYRPPQYSMREGAMMLKYKGGVQATFRFNNSMSHFTPISEDDMRYHVEATFLAGEDENNPRRMNLIDWKPILGLTVRFVWIQIPLTLIQERLDLLGIDTPIVPEEVEPELARRVHRNDDEEAGLNEEAIYSYG